MTEAQPAPPQKPHEKRSTHQSRSALKEHRRKLMSSIDKDAYGGIDLFEGTQPMQHSEPAAGQPDLGAPGDPGVDLSSIIGNASRIWESMK